MSTAANKGSEARGNRRAGWARCLCVFALLTLLCLGLAPVSRAQIYGKNKVQIHSIDWQVLHTPHFDIHYDAGAEEIAVRASIIAEKAYKEYADRLDRDLPWKVPFVLYTSHNDFAQTNISPYLIGEGTGGFTEPLRNRMVLPYNGSHADFVHVIRHELVHAFMFDMAYGPRGEFGRRYFYQIPLWRSSNPDPPIIPILTIEYSYYTKFKALIEWIC